MRGEKLNAINALKFLNTDESEIDRELREIQDSIDDRWTNDSIEFEDIFKGRGNRRGEFLNL
jgi:hypothetical protein